MSLGLIDIHTHLSSTDYKDDRDEMIARALQVCDVLIDIGAGTSPEAFDDARKLAEKYDSIYFTAGVHPHDAGNLGQDSKVRKRIEELAIHPKCVAIGECGLDYYYENSEPVKQKEVFEWQRDLALKHNLPLMIHTRSAEDDTKNILKDYKGPAVFHCFTGTQDLADFGIKKGFLISFSGIVTFKKAEDLKSVFLKTPLENIVVETDSPYLAPVPMRGKRNESSYIEHTVKFLSELRSISVNELASLTTKNALGLFKKIKSA